MQQGQSQRESNGQQDNRPSVSGEKTTTNKERLEREKEKVRVVTLGATAAQRLESHVCITSRPHAYRMEKTIIRKIRKKS